MNKLDTALPNVSRRADSFPLRSASQGMDDADAASGSGEIAVFDALLQDLSGAFGDDNALARRSVSDIDSVLALTDQTGTGAPDASDGVVGSAPDPRTILANMAELMMLVQGLTPQAPASATDRVPPGQSGEAIATIKAQNLQTSLSDTPQLPSEPLDEAAIRQSVTSAPALNAAITHQEAHFKPVVIASNLDAGKPDGSWRHADGREAPAIIEGSSQDVSKLEKLVTSETGLSPDNVTEAGNLANKQDKAHSDPLRASASMPAGEKPSPDASLSPAMLSRIASSVLSEAEKASEQLDGSISNADVATSSIKVRVSEGVMRILHLQLHPAELGTVTVRMRLTGDRLEMELHARNEETAKLLRKDTEALSNLLRTSGYRPDIVTVQSMGADVSQQDGPPFQRNQAPQFQTQADAFQQGASGSGPHRQQKTEEIQRNDEGRKKDRVDESAAINRSVGSLYL